MLSPETFPKMAAEAGLRRHAEGSMRPLLRLRDMDKTLQLRLPDDAKRFISPLESPPIRGDSGAGPAVAKLFDKCFAQHGISHDGMQVAAADAIVMHPGPMNHGIEIESSRAGGPASVIAHQVADRVALDLAVLGHVSQLMTTTC